MPDSGKLNAGLTAEVEETGSSLALVFLDQGADLDPLTPSLAFHFSQPTPFAAALASAPDRFAPRTKPMITFRRLGIAVGMVDSVALRRLDEDPRVRHVASAPALSLIRPVKKTAAAASSISKGMPWALDQLRAKEAWEKGATGKGVVVGHLDTGADGGHPMLKRAISSFAWIGGPEDVDEKKKATDTGIHGSHTAAIIAGRKVGGRSVGVAPESMLAVAAVIEGGNVVLRVLAGLEWILGKNAKVVNLSLGLRGWNSGFLALITRIRSLGVLPVVAIGNEGIGTSRSPGNYPNVLSVGAVDKKRKVADFSSSQTFANDEGRTVPKIVAPGVDIVSARAGGGYLAMSGTSMAAPHISGIAALLFSAKPTAKPDEVEKAILDSCRPLPAAESGRGGLGIPDAGLALERLLAG